MSQWKSILISGFVVAFSAVLVGSSNAQEIANYNFYDTHVHLNNSDAWIQLMDRSGVEKAVALAGRDINNIGLLEAGRQWPGRVFPLLSVSPEHREYRAAWVADDGTFIPLVDSLLSVGGFFGIGEISVTHFPGAGFPEADFNPNGNTMRGLFDLARKYDLPVLVHVEITRLREFEALLSDFKDVTTVWAHGGYTPYFLAARMLESHPNLVYELSARTWSHHPRSPDYTIFQNENTVWREWLDLVESMPTRFLVGTDASVRSEVSDKAKIRRVQLFLNQLSSATRDFVAKGNAARIFGF